MPRLPRISSRDVIRVLTDLGFEKVRQTGSHVVMQKKSENETIGCVVPMHRELKLGTLNGILKQAKVTVNELIDRL
jgi:predicted RNA binding protein YcfA (HicA-like mRNA interferase family)